MHWLRNSLSVLGVAGLCALSAPGCEENESMLFIVGVLAVVIFGYGYLLQVPKNADGPDEYVTCPHGVPTWWPWFLPH